MSSVSRRTIWITSSGHVSLEFVFFLKVTLRAREIRKTPSATVPAEEPQFPMFFTKRASSIIPHGAQIYHHSTVTNAVDYEGELGVIIGKGGFGIRKEDAWKHVWGATIINDVSELALGDYGGEESLD
jgi:2-keto-4-pentenoate hydratase/2-oxohepta-3-ene-1,7-dioic acid hydratase in catechol pathway